LGTLEISPLLFNFTPLLALFLASVFTWKVGVEIQVLGLMDVRDKALLLGVSQNKY
jgi:hypothetical protein